MKQELAHIALVVEDYDEAIKFYTEVLDFILLEDTRLSESKRWVRIAPPGSDGCGLLLATAANEKQKASIGNQTGGRVFLFLNTDDIDRDIEKMRTRGVSFVRPRTVFNYGVVAVFKDLYGNLWDLIEPDKDYPGNKDLK